MLWSGVILTRNNYKNISISFETNRYRTIYYIILIDFIALIETTLVYNDK